MARVPTARYRQAAAVLLTLSVLVTGAFFVAHYARWNNDVQALISPKVLNWLANRERVTHNVSELTVAPLLNEAAQRKADDMVARGYFAHVGPDGTQPWYWLDSVGYAYDYAGENLALNLLDSGATVEAWMASPGHRSNLLGSDYTEIGSGMATGTYNGFNVQYVVQLYARPAR